MISDFELNVLVFKLVVDKMQEFTKSGYNPADLAALFAGAAVLSESMATSKVEDDKVKLVRDSVEHARALIQSNCSQVSQVMAANGH